MTIDDLYEMLKSGRAWIAVAPNNWDATKRGVAASVHIMIRPLPKSEERA
jgi:hypothetical protein